jgi:glutamyl-tRNA reductase
VMIEFFDWYEMRKHVPLLKNLKSKLRELSIPVMHTSCPRKIDVEIQRVLNDTAGKIKLNNTGGCQYISAIHDFISAKN